jgi:hypothetical protein
VIEENAELRRAVARAHKDLEVVLEKPRFTWGFGIRLAMDRLCRVMSKFKIRREEAGREATGKRSGPSGAARGEGDSQSLVKGRQP